nr:transglutaminase family protein [Gloeothece citriformis]
MKYRLKCELSYKISQYSTFLFNICPVNTDFQTVIEEHLTLDPPLNTEEYITPVLGNRYFRVNLDSGNLLLDYQATVEVSYQNINPSDITETIPAQLPLETVPFLYPSRYCQSDRLIRLVQQEFGELQPGYSRVEAICNWIYDNVTYLSGSTNAQTSAYDTATERAGVCRDFAHLGIAFCRALNIPARFVSNYACGLEPPDFHAVFEAYLGDRWYLFDPTRLVPRQALIRIGTGRDAADVSFATLFGTVVMERKHICVEFIEGKFPSYTTDAVMPVTKP